MDRYYYRWPTYVPVAMRRRQVAEKIASMRKAGRDVSPVEIAGREIATTFWGEAWCRNLEAYSDYSNRLPRGRTYLRNGSVLDLKIEAGRVRTLVSGTDLYTVEIAIKPLPKKRWTEIKGRCAGEIDSLVELLQGSISGSVMEIVTRKDKGLFPSPREISLACSCPDWAIMCKHVAATLYGVGARLDHEPELLFTLRGVDPTEMVEAAVAKPAGNHKARSGRVLAASELSSVFGIDIDMDIDAESLGSVSTSTEHTGTTRRGAKARRAGSGARKKAVARTSARKAAAVKNTKTKAAAKPVATTKKPNKTNKANKANKKSAPAKKAPGRKSPPTTSKPSAKKSKAAKAGAQKPKATKRAAKTATPTRKPVAKKATKKTQK